MQDASGMIGRTEAREKNPPRLSLYVGDIKRVHHQRTGTGSSMAKHPKHNWHTHTIFSERRDKRGAFGGTGELHLLLDRCVGQRARGTCFNNASSASQAIRSPLL
ncbi:hypothetical protein AMTRI_Chr12g270520 [Amborella trichopoda]